MCVQAPACVSVRKQATERWPNRSQASDGICASPKHTTANPGSDHEPHVRIGGKAYATAVDLTDDKANGCDADAWAEHLRVTRDPRVKYVICNRRMFSSYPTRSCPAWEWRPYDGANPHDKHTHLSIVPEAIFDTRPWFPLPGEEDELTQDERDAVLTANHFVKVTWPGYAKKIDEIHQHLEVLMKGVPEWNLPGTPQAVYEIHDAVVKK